MLRIGAGRLTAGAVGRRSTAATRAFSILPSLRERAKMRTQMFSMQRNVNTTNGTAATQPASPPDGAPVDDDMSMRNVLRALAGNSFITVAKFGSFSVSGSSAMLSEAIHTLVDTGNQVLLYVGLKASRKEADAAHPYGYGRAAFFYSLVSAMGIFWVGCGVAVYHGITHIIHLPEVPIEYGMLTWATLGVSFLIDGGVLVGAIKDIKKEAGSTPFWQHFRRIKDPFILTVVLEDFAATTGIGIAIAGIAASKYTANPLWDGVASIAVGTLLGGVAMSLIAMNREFLLGKAIDPVLEQRVTDIICQRPSVDHVYRVKSRWEGPNTFAYKSELDFEGAYFAKLLRELYKDKFHELYDMRSSNGGDLDVDERDEKLQRLLQVYSEDLTRCIEREIFAIQQEVRAKVPTAEWVELQPLSKTLQPYALREGYPKAAGYDYGSSTSTRKT